MSLKTTLSSAVVVLLGSLALTACQPGGTGGTGASGAGMPSQQSSVSTGAGDAATPVPGGQVSTPPAPPSGGGQQVGASAALYDCSGAPVSQPTSVVLSCADSGLELDHVQWTDWGQPTASATAVLSETNCTPNCASGGTSTYQATVTVSRLRGGAYTHMTISAPTSPTPESAYTVTHAGPHAAS